MWYLAILFPVLVSLGLRASAPAVLRQCSPSWSVRLLVGLSLVAALGTGLSLYALAGLGIAQFPFAANVAHWSADAISDATPVPLGIGLTAAVVAALLTVLSVVHLVRTLIKLRRATLAGRALHADDTGLVVVVDPDRVEAYAIPGPAWSLARRPARRGGRVVATTALFALLDDDEQRAVLAHERAHLRHGHMLYVQLAELARAANPLLGSVPRVVRQAIEAWADQDSVAEVDDPICVAQALAKVGLHRQASTSAAMATALGAADSDIAVRVRALLDPAPRRTRRWAVITSVATALCVLGAGSIAVRVHADVESAQVQWHMATDRH